MSGEERRDEVINIAIAEFAKYGLYGASTETIADKAGISQPYIFRLFDTKKKLFLSATQRVCDRIRATFQEAAASDPENPLKAMGYSYHKLLSQRNELLMLLQAFAASEDPEVQSSVRKGYKGIIDFVKETSKASDEEVAEFFAIGMGLTVGAVLDLLDFMKLEKERTCD